MGSFWITPRVQWCSLMINWVGWGGWEDSGWGICTHIVYSIKELMLSELHFWRRVLSPLDGKRSSVNPEGEMTLNIH